MDTQGAQVIRPGYVSPPPISVGRALSRGWAAFQKHAGVAIGTYLIYTAMSLVAGSVPLVNIIFSLVIQYVLTGGFIILMLNIVRNDNPTVGDLFAGFSDFGKWLGVGYLYVVVVLASLVPFGIAALLGALIAPAMAAAYGSSSDIADAPMIAFMVLGGLVSLILLCALMIRWVFAYYVAAEGAGTIEAFKRSAEMTQGIRLRLFGIYLVLGLFTLAGILALGVGIIVTALIAYLAQASIYLDLKPQAPQPAPEPAAQ